MATKLKVLMLLLLGASVSYAGTVYIPPETMWDTWVMQDGDDYHPEETKGFAFFALLATKDSGIVCRYCRTLSSTEKQMNRPPITYDDSGLRLKDEPFGAGAAFGFMEVY
jgi:hypothetical protein